MEDLRSSTPSAAERDIMRYYYYIHHGVDTRHVAPLEQSWIDNVMSKIKKGLRDGRERSIDFLCGEMRDDYLLSVKKAIVDFVLKDPRERPEDVEIILPSHRQAIAEIPKPWNRSFKNATEFIEKHLHTINSCIKQLPIIWKTTYSDLKLIDAKQFHEKAESMELTAFHSMCMRQIDKGKERLLKKWYHEVKQLFYQGGKATTKKIIPSSKEPIRLQNFYNCANSAMTLIMQDLGLVSMDDYTNVLIRSPESTRAFEHSGLVIRLLLDETQIKYEPTFAEFEVVLLSIYDALIKAVGILPLLETYLLPDWVNIFLY